MDWVGVLFFVLVYVNIVGCLLVFYSAYTTKAYRRQLARFSLSLMFSVFLQNFHAVILTNKFPYEHVEEVEDAHRRLYCGGQLPNWMGLVGFIMTIGSMVFLARYTLKHGKKDFPRKTEIWIHIITYVTMFLVGIAMSTMCSQNCLDVLGHQDYQFCIHWSWRAGDIVWLVFAAALVVLYALFVVEIHRARQAVALGFESEKVVELDDERAKRVLFLRYESVQEIFGLLKWYPTVLVVLVATLIWRVTASAHREFFSPGDKVTAQDFFRLTLPIFGITCVVIYFAKGVNTVKGITTAPTKARKGVKFGAVRMRLYTNEASRTNYALLEEANAEMSSNRSHPEPEFDEGDEEERMEVEGIPDGASTCDPMEGMALDADRVE